MENLALKNTNIKNIKKAISVFPWKRDIANSDVTEKVIFIQ